MLSRKQARIFFFFNDTATTEIYTLSLHDALPISKVDGVCATGIGRKRRKDADEVVWVDADRKSTRLNSSHSQISYAVFCLKKKKAYRGRRTRASAGRGRSLPRTTHHHCTEAAARI